MSKVVGIEEFKGESCKMDYSDNTVTVYFEGFFDSLKAIEYMLQCYPEFEGRELIDFSPHHYFRGLENIGSATFSGSRIEERKYE